MFILGGVGGRRPGEAQDSFPDASWQLSRILLFRCQITAKPCLVPASFRSNY